MAIRVRSIPTRRPAGTSIVMVFTESFLDWAIAVTAHSNSTLKMEYDRVFIFFCYLLTGNHYGFYDMQGGNHRVDMIIHHYPAAGGNKMRLAPVAESDGICHAGGICLE